MKLSTSSCASRSSDALSRRLRNFCCLGGLVTSLAARFRPRFRQSSSRGTPHARRPVAEAGAEARLFALGGGTLATRFAGGRWVIRVPAEEANPFRYFRPRGVLPRLRPRLCFLAVLP
jgi:hypothetical protein